MVTTNAAGETVKTLALVILISNINFKTLKAIYHNLPFKAIHGPRQTFSGLFSVEKIIAMCYKFAGIIIC